MKFTAALSMMLAALSLAPSPALSAEVVANVLGEEISRSQLAAAGEGPAQVAAQVARFRDLLWERVAKHYVAERGLAATPAELAELSGYHREFERRDRAQRARKLDELNQRLAAGGLAAEERARLEGFRAVLARMAQNDAESDREPPPDPAREAALAAPFVEWWKMNRALYEQYGGTVALTTSGPLSHGARAALVAEYERRDLVRFLDSRMREQLFTLLAAPPARVVPPDRVDFTPYWKLPIPPSYFPD